MEILGYLYASVWFMLPAGMANMAPVLGAKLFPQWDYPLDFYAEYRGKRLLGEHKTVRGLVLAVLVGLGTFAYQRTVSVGSAYAWIDYGSAPWYLGGIFGFGAIIGDAVKSLVKRRINIPPGKPWFPFDQSDWIIGTLVALMPWVRLPVTGIVSVFVTGIAAHLLSKILGKMVRLNQSYI